MLKITSFFQLPQYKVKCSNIDTSSRASLSWLATVGLMVEICPLVGLNGEVSLGCGKGGPYN